MRILILHHSDLDGFLAGDLAKLHYPDAETLSLNYAKDAPIPAPQQLDCYSLVIIVDYSLPVATMQSLHGQGKAIWIDHHASAIRLAKAHGYDDLPGLRCREDEKICGAELAWTYFEKAPIPRLLKLTGDYDTYRNVRTPAFETEVLPFFYATQLHFEQRFLPANFRKEGFLLNTRQDFQNDARCDEMIATGRLLLDYSRSTYRQLGKENAFVRQLWGYRVLGLNCPGHGSTAIQPSFHPEEHDLMLTFSYNGACWSYGLYTDEEAKPQIDVSAIAASYGGGGHKAAAGFSLPNLLPELGN